MSSDTLSILTALGIFLGGLAAISQSTYNILRKERARKTRTNGTSTQSGQGPKINWTKALQVLRFAGFIGPYLLGLLVLFSFHGRHEPLTASDAALITICLIFCLPVACVPPKG